MTYEVQDEELKRLIKKRAIKNGFKSGECIVRYGGRMYLVDFEKDKVVLQIEYK